MIARTAARRIFTPKGIKPVAPVSSLGSFANQRRSFSEDAVPKTGGGILQRFRVTAEVVVSKIFPGGFGWQYGSVVAGGMGLTPTDINFFIYTGLGDFTGVFVGHTTYYILKSFVDKSVSASQEIQTGLFLGSAAFCSGFIWQPTVNLLQAANIPFINVASGTWMVCGASFFAGLRLFRLIYSPIMSISANNYDNLKTDASLSVAIGGATGAFVGTDVNYQGGEGNFLRPYVGVEAGMTDIEGCIKAGSSTALGFAVAQIAENLTYAQGKNWTD